MYNVRIVISVLALVATITSITLRKASADLTCTFNGKESRAIVKNNNPFQKTCTFECHYATEGNEYMHKGSAGLNPGESFESKGTGSAKITKRISQTTNCEK